MSVSKFGDTCAVRDLHAADRAKNNLCTVRGAKNKHKSPRCLYFIIFGKWIKFEVVQYIFCSAAGVVEIDKNKKAPYITGLFAKETYQIDL